MLQQDLNVRPSSTPGVLALWQAAGHRPVLGARAADIAGEQHHPRVPTRNHQLYTWEKETRKRREMYNEGIGIAS